MLAGQEKAAEAISRRSLVWLQAVHVQFARDTGRAKSTTGVVATGFDVDFAVSDGGDGELEGVSSGIRRDHRTVPQIRRKCRGCVGMKSSPSARRPNVPHRLSNECAAPYTAVTF